MIEPGTVVAQVSTPKGEVAIRYPRPDDLSALLDFINALSREQTYILFQGEQMTLEEEEAWLSARLKELADGRAVSLCVIHAGTVIGTAAVTLKGLAERHVGVLGISVQAGYRRLGIGAALLDAVLSEAETKLEGLRIIELGVFGNNPVARKLYESRGFIEHGTLPGGVRHRDAFVDHILMHRRVY